MVCINFSIFNPIKNNISLNNINLEVKTLVKVNNSSEYFIISFLTGQFILYEYQKESSSITVYNKFENETIPPNKDSHKNYIFD